MPQIVAGQCRIGIAFVGHPGQAGIAGISLDVAPGHIQQRPEQCDIACRPLDRNTRRAIYARSAQQIEQYRFRLVAAMVGKQQPFPGYLRKSRIAGIAGSCLDTEAGSAIDRYMTNDERHPQAAAIVAAKGCPAIGIGRQAMMHMHGLQRVTPLRLGEDMQQDDGVTATGQPHRKGGTGRDAGGKHIADPLPQIN
ncbi:hypothetical protein SDC9_166633 [bioreactor metagenome]|uniref:Uncharacterized protein n=1 Tax=bioreactor metagenome TaxID=1076179 RepID=A0A645FZB3_9ZZZZ